MKIISLFLLVLALLLSDNANCQQLNNPEVDEIDTTNKVDLIDVFKTTFRYKPERMKKRSKRKIYFSLLPTSSQIPGGGKALITSTTASFYMGPRKVTNLSTVTFSPYLNFKGRYAISFRSNVYTKMNRWNIQGDTRFSLFPEFIFGQENTENENNKLLISYKYIRFYQTVLKQFKPYFLAGIGYNLDYHINIESVNDSVSLSKFVGYEHGTEANKNSFSSGITFNALYDSRNNSVNPVPGGYINLIYRVNPSFLGNGSSSWSSVYLDTRKYINLQTGEKRKLLALWSYVWAGLSDNIPFLDLPGIGYEPYQRSGRGVPQNKYRGKNLVYFESEYRSDLTKNGLFGFVVFANAHANTGPADNIFRGVHPAIGGGLRIKFNKRSNSNIAIDYGFSKGHSGLTLNLGEVF